MKASIIPLIFMLTACDIESVAQESAQSVEAQMGVNTYPIDLTVAATKKRLGVSGKYLTVDNSSTGQATAYVDSVSAGGISLQPGFSARLDFKDLFLDYAAQEGQNLLLIYGDDPSILNSGNVVSTTASPTVLSFIYDISNGAGTPTVNIVTAANNKNGILVLGGTLSVRAGKDNASGLKLYNITAAGPTYAAVAANVTDAARSGDDFQTLVLPQLRIPPGYSLSIIDIPFDKGVARRDAWAFINYRVL